MTLTAEARARLVEALSEIHRDFQAARGLFRLHVGELLLELPVEGCDWHAVPGVSGGAEMCPLPVQYWPADAPPHTDYFATRGHQGARPDQPIRLLQDVRVEVLRGVINYKKESWAGYVEHHPGDVFTVEPGEAYTFLAVTDFFNRVAFTPRITQPTA